MSHKARLAADLQ